MMPVVGVYRRLRARISVLSAAELSELVSPPEQTPQQRRDYVVIALLAIVPVVILRPFQNTPFIDDWVYGWSVEHLLHTGQLKILDISTSLNLAQILWGALFCLPFGFSFSALRISTWTLSVFGLFGFYNLMRSVGISRRDALLSTALLEACPVYFILSFTYMTDVPWLVMAIWFAYCLIKAVSMKQDRWLAAAAVFAFLAGAIRLTGVLLPLVMLSTLVFHSGGWGRRPRRLWLPLVALVALIVLISSRFAYTVHLSDPVWSYWSLPERRVDNLKLGLLQLYRFIPQGIIYAAATLGIFLVPWVAGCVRRADLRRSLMVCGVILLISAVSINAGGRYATALAPGFTWSLYELGNTESLINPDEKLPQTANWWDWPLAVIMYLTLSIAVAFAIRRSITPGVLVMQWMLVGEFLVICILWLFYDRYLLMALPFIAVLVVQTSGFIRPGASLAIGLLFLILSTVGVRDHLEYNRAVWGGVAYLHDLGAKDSEIHGGWPINGWLQYAHPQNAPIRNAKGEIRVPWVNDKFMLPYQIANQPMEGWSELTHIPYKRWLGHSGSIYVLRRDDSAQE
jgi:hypothetical protein